MRSAWAEKAHALVAAALASTLVVVAGGGVGMEANERQGNGSKDDDPYVCVWIEKYGIRKYICIRIPDDPNEQIIEDRSDRPTPEHRGNGAEHRNQGGSGGEVPDALVSTVGDTLDQLG